MRLILAFIATLAFGTAAHASDWVVYGQTMVPTNGSVIDPSPNTAGVVGEVASLPYVVPAGMCLTITAYGIESYYGIGTAVLFPWLGEMPPTNRKALVSVGANSGTREVSGFMPRIRGGTKVHVMMLNGQSPAQVLAWYVRGTLDNGPCWNSD